MNLAQKEPDDQTTIIGDVLWMFIYTLVYWIPYNFLVLACLVLGFTFWRVKYTVIAYVAFVIFLLLLGKRGPACANETAMKVKLRTWEELSRTDASIPRPVFASRDDSLKRYQFLISVF